MGLLTQNQNEYYDSGNLSNYGDYQFVSLKHIISGFIVSYVGEGKIISKVNKADVQFHAMRGLQEFSYDVFKCVKSQEIEVPNTLKMILPQDYVNYSKITRVDNDGVERILYPTGKTSNPLAINQNDLGEYNLQQGTNDSDFRQIEIQCPDGATLVDGDYIELAYYDSSNPPGTAADATSIYFIFSSDSDFTDGANPSPSNSTPRHFVNFHPSNGAVGVAQFLTREINDTKHFKATYNSAGVVTVTYLTKEFTLDVTGSTDADRNEGAYAADGTVTSRFTITEVSQFKKFKITCKAGDQFNDGDILTLPYIQGDGVTEGNINILFDKSIPGNLHDNTFVGEQNASPRFHIQFNNNNSAEVMATKVEKAIKETNRFTVVRVGSDVFVTFKDNLSQNIVAYSSIPVFGAPANNQLIVATLSEGFFGDLSLKSESETWSRYKSGNTNSTTTEDYDREDHTLDVLGRRYGLDPQHAQGNGTFYIDTKTGFIHFGSSLSGQTIVLHYISDGLGTDDEMVVHKFAEEAIYKWIAYGIVASRSNMPEYIVQRFKKERFAEARKAKIRLSNIKIEEFAQIIKGLSKPIK